MVYETIFGSEDGNQLKIVWSQIYNSEDRTSTIAITNLYVRSNTDMYAGAGGDYLYLHGAIQVRDLNKDEKAKIALSLSFTSPANNRVYRLGTEWAEVSSYQLGYQPESITISHGTSGEASIEIFTKGIRIFEFSNGSFLGEQSVISFLGGIARIDSGGDFILGVPYICTGDDWVQATPYIDTGSSWVACG